MPDTEIVRHQSAEVAQFQEPTAMGMIAQAVQKGADVATIERLVALKERLDRTEAEKAFYEAKARLHAKLPQIEQSGVVLNKAGGVQSRYSKYEDIDMILRPLLAEEGFSLEFDSESQHDKLLMSGTLAHRQGHRETRRLPLPLDTSGAKNNIQGMGSTVSYGKRYLLGMLLNLVSKGQDDDGQGGKAQLLTQEQRDEVEFLIKETKAEPAKVLAWINAPSIAEIRQVDFKRVMDALRRKAAK